MPLKNVLSALLFVMIAASSQAIRGETDVTRATLDNGLRVVIIRDPLAPVATVYDNYLVGANETPPEFPGMAHAQEHMAYRGCAGMSADQTSAISTQLGGNNSAETHQTITQYFSTVPATDLEIALRLDAACMQDIDDAQSEWAEERAAIEQEVSLKLSDPTSKMMTRVNEDMFSGTPYAHDGSGTRASFDATTGPMLKSFYQTWYAPNNAILVVAGDVDPATTLSTITSLYGKIPKKTLPARSDMALPPVKAETFNIESNLPYETAFLLYRLAGTDSPDFAATQILCDVLLNPLMDMHLKLLETYPKASVAAGAAPVLAGTDSSAMVVAMRASFAAFVKNGLPADLVEAAKGRETAGAVFRRNSIPDLAGAWSQALAAEGRTSPDDDIVAMQKVTVADVNRVAKQYLVDDNSIAAVLVPSPSAEPMLSGGFSGGERTMSAATKPVALPAWAEALAKLTVPKPTVTWTDITLPNKLRLIVKTETTSPTVTVMGGIRHDAQLQVPRGKDGAAEVLTDLLSDGTASRDQAKFQKALDDIAANESAGYDFSVRVLKQNFSRGVELLADNVLHPALRADAFADDIQATVESTNDDLKSPEHKTGRAVRFGLLPPGDPDLRETTPETVSALTLVDIKQLHAATFRPDLTTIVVIGDVTPVDARTTIQRSFGAWSAAAPPPDLTMPPVPQNAPSAVNVPDHVHVQSEVTLAQEVGITRLDPDYYALQLGVHVLGGGFYATRLEHDLRQVAGLVYNVDESLSATRSRTVYRVVYGCDPDAVSKAREIIVRELRAMQTTNVPDQELNQAKAFVLRQMLLDESSEDTIAGGLLDRAQMGLPLDEPARAAKRYADLTADAVRAAFAKWIRPDGFVQVVRGPAEK